jgi:hypothetical protein
MEKGQLSYSKVRTLTRAATPENEEALLDFARAGSAANLDRFIRGWKLLDRKTEVTAEELRHQRRRFSAFVDADGMVVVRGRLDPEVGAVLMRAIEAATDALYRDEVRRRKGAEGLGAEDRSPRGAEGSSGPGLHSRDLERAQRTVAEAELGEPTPAQRRADAVGLLAERALAAGFGHSLPAGSEASGSHPSLLPAGSGGGSDKASKAIPLSGTRAERYMVMIHVDEATLREHGEPGLSELHDGTRISAETSRRLACDCSVVKIHRGPDGQVRGTGRRRRTVSPQLRRALEARDRGCRFPGCGARFTEAHHVVHWQDGGDTTLDNSLLLCRRHHRAVHEGRVTVCLDADGQAVFFTPKGKALAGAPPRKLPPQERPATKRPATERPATERPAEERPAAEQPGPERSRTERPEALGFQPPKVNAWGAAPRYNRDHHIPWEEEARAWEALDPA